MELRKDLVSENCPFFFFLAIYVGVIKYFFLSLLILLCFPCVKPSAGGFPPRGHPSLPQHLVNAFSIPPLSFYLCQHLETFRVTSVFLL